jgi:transposase
MARPLSQDLRERIINAYLEPGATLKSVTSRFQVGTATVTRMAAKHRKGESLLPKKMPGRTRKAIIGEELKLLRNLVMEFSDYSGQELAWELQERTGNGYHRATINRRLVEMGFSVKKNTLCRREIDRKSKKNTCHLPHLAETSRCIQTHLHR